MQGCSIERVEERQRLLFKVLFNQTQTVLFGRLAANVIRMIKSIKELGEGGDREGGLLGQFPMKKAKK